MHKALSDARLIRCRKHYLGVHILSSPPQAGDQVFRNLEHRVERRPLYAVLAFSPQRDLSNDDLWPLKATSVQIGAQVGLPKTVRCNQSRPIVKLNELTYPSRRTRA